VTAPNETNQPTNVTGFIADLVDRRTSIGVWGAGAIGSSAAYYFALHGYRCIAYDISKERVREIAEGRFQSTAAHGADEAALRPDLGVKASNKWHDLDKESVSVHLIAVPTERAAEPSSASLADVIPRIARVIKKTDLGYPPIVSVESTILPSWVKDVVVAGLESEGLRVGEDVLVGAAPRRDWFNGADYTIETLPRIVGGMDGLTTDLLVALYAPVCNTVQPAMDAEHAAFTKVIENVIRYEGITFGNTLSLAFPQYDMRHILRLASTKWNIPYYFPSLGIGGHCIPLAPQYVVEAGGPDNPYLKSVRDSLAFNADYMDNLYQRRLRDVLKGKRRVGVLGLAYTPNAKMHKLSPAFEVLDVLRDTPSLRLHDPFYSDDEIYDLCSVGRFQFPDDISDFDALILVTAHAEYVSCPIEDYVEPGTAVIDNTGVWAQRQFKDGVEYYEIGRVRGRPGPAKEPSSPTAA
jgi:nucleotide sugar dehydrogenase